MLDLSSRKVYGALAEQCVGGDTKADKVETAVAGHLAGLDANGNLTDSGVSPTEEVTVEGNPVQFDSPFEQDAKSVVVSVKPIQDLHGYDHPWVGGAGKNKWSYGNITTETESDVPLSLSAGTYTFSGVKSTNSIELTIRFNYIDETSKLCSNIDVSGETITFDKDVVSFNFSVAGFSSGDTITNIQIEAGSFPTTFAPYSNICPISGIDEVKIGVSDGESEPTTTTISLPSTLYGGEMDVTEGTADDEFGFISGSSISDLQAWATAHGVTLDIDTSTAGLLIIGFPNVSVPVDIDTVPDRSLLRCNEIENETALRQWTINKNAITINYNGSLIFSVADITTQAAMDAWLTANPIQIAFKLATPTTLSFTPADVELLEGTNVVSTNGEKVAVTYGRSLWQDINDLKTDTEGKLDKSDVATIEGDTASKAYSVNDFMLRSDGFYKVTQPIAQNASITASNTTKTTVGEVLTALLNA